ncbi:DNA binding protein [Microbacterium phage Bee17]|nr:DNA binding protein [Microbacterium phage Badulia]WGH21148.1 DNA binding protein [Microbacterium phage Bee17]
MDFILAVKPVTTVYRCSLCKVNSEDEDRLIEHVMLDSSCESRSYRVSS